MFKGMLTKARERERMQEHGEDIANHQTVILKDSHFDCVDSEGQYGE